MDVQRELALVISFDRLRVDQVDTFKKGWFVFGFVVVGLIVECYFPLSSVVVWFDDDWDSTEAVLLEHLISPMSVVSSLNNSRW